MPEKTRAFHAHAPRKKSYILRKPWLVNQYSGSFEMTFGIDSFTLPLTFLQKFLSQKKKKKKLDPSQQRGSISCRADLF
jgi:hypothetical protein